MEGRALCPSVVGAATQSRPQEFGRAEVEMDGDVHSYSAGELGR